MNGCGYLAVVSWPNGSNEVFDISQNGLDLIEISGVGSKFGISLLTK